MVCVASIKISTYLKKSANILPVFGEHAFVNVRDFFLSSAVVSTFYRIVCDGVFVLCGDWAYAGMCNAAIMTVVIFVFVFIREIADGYCGTEAMFDR